MGWGCIAIGIVALCPGVLEMASGMYSPVGYSQHSRWLTGATTIFFGSYGPFASAAIWFGLGSCLIWSGVRGLRAHSVGTFLVESSDDVA